MRVSGSKTSSPAAALANTRDAVTDPAMVGALPGDAALESARSRRQIDVDRKEAFHSLGQLLSDFSSATDDMVDPNRFRKLKAESSDPNVLEAQLTGFAKEGQYDISINELARAPRQIFSGFPDKDKTPVGFGFFALDLDGNSHDIEIPPGSTLSDVASIVNEKDLGVRASIINTGNDADDKFVLMIKGINDGEASSISLDPDTTFLNIDRQDAGSTLKATFEGVDIKRDGNNLDELVDGLSLKAKTAKPGHAVSVAIKPDFDQTANQVTEFVKQYNQLQSFTTMQSQKSETTGEAGLLSGDGAVRQASRSVQSVLQGADLHHVGISTDPKSGQLKLDETKLKLALNNNHEHVVGLFASAEGKVGLAEKMSQVIKSLKDKTNGPVGLRLKGLDERIRRQDREIEKKERSLEAQKIRLKEQFASINSRMQVMESQNQFLSSRLSASSADQKTPTES
jgi:flagellar hook-associated protein 2